MDNNLDYLTHKPHKKLIKLIFEFPVSQQAGSDK